MWKTRYGLLAIAVIVLCFGLSACAVEAPVEDAASEAAAEPDAASEGSGETEGGEEGAEHDGDSAEAESSSGEE